MALKIVIGGLISFVGILVSFYYVGSNNSSVVRVSAFGLMGSMVAFAFFMGAFFLEP